MTFQKKLLFFLDLHLFLFIPLLWAQETVIHPQRIISMAPNLTEIVYDIGAGDKLVGVTDFCKFPPEAQSKEKIGGWINPNYEKILSLKPDLVLALQFHGKAVDNLRKLKVPLLVLDCQTVQDVLEAYDLLGKRLGLEKEAKAAKARLKERLDRIKDKTERFHHRPSVLFVIEHDPGSLKEIYGVGPKNFIDELIRWAGGSNLLSDAPVPYPLVSRETLIQRNPDVIINALPMFTKPQDLITEKAVWKQMPVLKAVKKDQVYCFNNGDYMVPGPTLVKLAEYLSGIFQKVEAGQ